MDIQELKVLLTDKAGWWAALAALISLVGGFMGLVRPWLQRRRDRQDSQPVLQFANFQCEAPPPWSDAGKVSFELINVGGGRAVMSALHLDVKASGPCLEPKMVEAAAPVPVYTYKVTLKPGVLSHDVRQREFGSDPPHTFDKAEVESIVVELRSQQAQWYEFELVLRWYSARQPDQARETRSPLARIAFKADAMTLLDLDARPDAAQRA